MPLLRGANQDVIAENIRREMHAGRSQKQAIAIAFSEARRSHKNWSENPLLRGYSQDIIAENIRRAMHAGRSQKQAIAIAFDEARRTGMIPKTQGCVVALSSGKGSRPNKDGIMARKAPKARKSPRKRTPKHCSKCPGPHPKGGHPKKPGTKKKPPTAAVKGWAQKAHNSASTERKRQHKHSP